MISDAYHRLFYDVSYIPAVKVRILKGLFHQQSGAPTKRSGFSFLLDFSTVLRNKHYSDFEMISGQNSRKI